MAYVCEDAELADVGAELADVGAAEHTDGAEQPVSDAEHNEEQPDVCMRPPELT